MDIDLGENQVEGALVSVCDHSQTVAKSLELRQIKVKAKAVSLPVSFAAAFEGEIIRKKDTYAEKISQPPDQSFPGRSSPLI